MCSVCSGTASGYSSVLLHSHSSEPSRAITSHVLYLPIPCIGVCKSPDGYCCLFHCRVQKSEAPMEAAPEAVQQCFVPFAR